MHINTKYMKAFHARLLEKRSRSLSRGKMGKKWPILALKFSVKNMLKATLKHNTVVLCKENGYKEPLIFEKRQDFKMWQKQPFCIGDSQAKWSCICFFSFLKLRFCKRNELCHSQVTERLNRGQKHSLKTHIVLKINLFGLFKRFGSGRNIGSL